MGKFNAPLLDELCDVYNNLEETLGKLEEGLYLISNIHDNVNDYGLDEADDANLDEIARETIKGRTKILEGIDQMIGRLQSYERLIKATDLGELTHQCMINRADWKNSRYACPHDYEDKYVEYLSRVTMLEVKIREQLNKVCYTLPTELNNKDAIHTENSRLLPDKKKNAWNE